MRITGFFEDDEGNGRYFIEWMDSAGKKYGALYSEADRYAEGLSVDEARSLFESGALEKCSFPASEILFPDELEELVEKFENTEKEESE